VFTDGKSKKIFVSHCVLNQNTKSDGTACYQGANESIAAFLVKAEQMVFQIKERVKRGRVG
jgi:hypothetical protein